MKPFSSPSLLFSSLLTLIVVELTSIAVAIPVAYPEVGLVSILTTYNDANKTVGNDGYITLTYDPTIPTGVIVDARLQGGGDCQFHADRTLGNETEILIISATVYSEGVPAGACSIVVDARYSNATTAITKGVSFSVTSTRHLRADVSGAADIEECPSRASFVMTAQEVLHAKILDAGSQSLTVGGGEKSWFEGFIVNRTTVLGGPGNLAGHLTLPSNAGDWRTIIEVDSLPGLTHQNSSLVLSLGQNKTVYMNLRGDAVVEDDGAVKVVYNDVGSIHCEVITLGSVTGMEYQLGQNVPVVVPPGYGLPGSAKGKGTMSWLVVGLMIVLGTS